VTLDKKVFTIFFPKRKWQQPHLFPHLFLIAFLEEAFIRNIIITFIIKNKAVINDNLWKTPNPYFALHNCYGQAKVFLRNLYRNSEHAPSNRIASPGLKTLGFSTSLSPKGVYRPLMGQL